MSRQTTLYIMAFITIISAGMIVSYFTRHSLDLKEIQPVFSSGSDRPKVIQQKSKERTWESFAFEKVFSINDLARPESVKVDSEDNILVLDWSEAHIKKFSSQGQLIGLYGKGRGSGPGEFLSPTDFTLTKVGQLWVTDSEGVISVFDRSGEIIRTISPKTPAERIVHGDEDRFIAMRATKVASLWQTYTDYGELQNTFGQLIEDQSQNAISLEGWIEGDGSNSFYYAGLYAGLLACYNFDGECQFFVQTIDPHPLPKIQITPQGGKKVADKQLVSALSISVSNDKIYLLTEMRSNEAKRNVIDVYSKNNGLYLYSVETPESCHQIFIKDGYAYTLHEKSVTKWRL